MAQNVKQKKSTRTIKLSARKRARQNLKARERNRSLYSLMRGKINLFSLDTLIDMVATAGMSPTVKVSKPKATKHARPKRGAEAEMATT